MKFWKLTDIHGKKYLDFFPGWGVSNLGHCHPKVMGAVREQIGKLIHIPNNFYNPYQAKLAKELVRISFDGKIFFCNSGTEAIEAAIKFARMYGEGKKFEIITTINAFHGRTMGALTATGQEKHQKGFGPLVPGFKYVPFNDIQAFKAAVNDQTAAIILELVQGEGGINASRPKNMSKRYVRYVMRKRYYWSSMKYRPAWRVPVRSLPLNTYGVKPDVMCIAKALGGGLPIGAMMSQKRISADTF